MRLYLLSSLAAATLLAACARESGVSKPPEVAPVAVAPPAATPDGAKLYAQNCAVCHMVDGTGVPYVQPALAGNPALAADPTLPARVLLFGPAQVLPADREHYSNQMPPFVQLSDAEIAALVTYIRKNFSDGGDGLTAEQVAALRRAGPGAR